MGQVAIGVVVEEGNRRMTVHGESLARDFLSRWAAGGNGEQPIKKLGLPRIGEVWEGEGGIFAGLVRGEDGQPDYYLVVHTAQNAAGPWQAAMDWAKNLQADGHHDFVLPNRREQAILYGNVPELFEKAWYWSGVTHASHPSSAWMQDFYDGLQGNTLKVLVYRARAVRRVPI
jgi:hypothetical protein